MTVAVQLAMGQFSPRIVSALLRDRLHQLTFALLAATVVFDGVALRGIDDGSPRLPGLTIMTANVLALAGIAFLIVFVARVGERLRASGLIDLGGDELHQEIELRFPPDGHAPPRDGDGVPAPKPGVVVAIDVPGPSATGTTTSFSPSRKCGWRSPTRRALAEGRREPMAHAYENVSGRFQENSSTRIPSGSKAKKAQ